MPSILSEKDTIRVMFGLLTKRQLIKQTSGLWALAATTASTSTTSTPIGDSAASAALAGWRRRKKISSRDKGLSFSSVFFISRQHKALSASKPFPYPSRRNCSIPQQTGKSRRGHTQRNPSDFLRTKPLVSLRPAIRKQCRGAYGLSFEASSGKPELRFGSL